jgi:hypothetical protein
MARKNTVDQGRMLPESLVKTAEKQNKCFSSGSDHDVFTKKYTMNKQKTFFEWFDSFFVETYGESW